jgi:hypothetical protein
MAVLMKALLALAVLATVGMLAAGLISMARGGTKSAAEKSNLFMRYRILFQGVAVLIVVLILALTDK